MVRLIRHLKDARARGGALSLRDDGHRRPATRLPDPLDRRAGPAGLSLARAHHLRSGARARPARSTRAPRRRRRSRRSSARRRRRLRGRERGGVVFRPRRVELPPAHPALRESRASRRRRRRLHHRQRARRPDARALRSRRLSGGRAALHARRRRARRARPGDRRSPTRPTGPNTARMCATAAPRCASRSIRCGRTRRSTRSASTFTRRSPTGATAPDHADLAEARSRLRPRLSARAASPAARPSTGTTRARRTGARRPARRSPTAPTASPGCSAPRIWSAGGRTRMSSASAGVETAATAWAPRAKPIWLTEIGVPAVDKGANGPNVFPDPKSSESAHPAVLGRQRATTSSRRAPLEAILSRFDPALPGHPAGANPVSPVYGGPMVDPGHVFVWAWDARPFPAFPDFDLVWADGGELADRALDHRPARGHARSIASSPPCSPISASTRGGARRSTASSTAM